MDLNNLVSAFGWTIINSLWQGLFILLVLAITLVLINPKFAKIRSMIAYASLLLIFAASIRTFSDLHSAQSQYNQTVTSSITESKFVIFHKILEEVDKEPGTRSSETEYFLNYVSKFGNQNLTYIVVFWLIGILLLSIKMIGGYIYIQKIKRNSIFEVEDKWLKTIQNISNRLQLSTTVQLFESAIVKYPTVIGYLKPVILMPIGNLAEMPMAQVEMILAHELAHVKRADYLLNLIQSFLEILYFFNPAVWIIAKIIRNEREFACDDMAISLSENGSTLASALLSIHQKDANRPAIALSALGTKNSLLRRIKRMVQNNNNNTDYPKRFVLSSVLLIGLFTLTIIACSSSSDNYNDRYSVTSAGMNFNSSPSTLENMTEKVNTEEMIVLDTREKNQQVEIVTSVDDSEDKRKFNFHKNDTHWKGTIENGKVVTLYKDGHKIAQSDIKNHEGFILETVKEIDEDMAEFEIDMQGFKEDMARLKEDLSDLKIDLNFEHLNEINEHFNSEEFHKEMSELKESLHKIEFDFDDEWKHELKGELEKLDNIDFDFDKESFKESMRELKENMKDFKIDMSNLDIDLSDLKIDLKELKVEMKKLKSFLNELRPDLVKEGYIESEDEDFELELNKSTIEVNGKKLPGNLHKRYLKMYKEHFGKELETDFTIHN